MLNEQRVKLMTTMASYESKEGKEDLKISAYYRKDYVSIHVIWTVIWSTVGYIIAAAIAMIAFWEKLLADMNTRKIILLAIIAIVVYLIVIIISVVVTNKICKEGHNRARQRVKKFNHYLLVLKKMYEKENR